MGSPGRGHFCDFQDFWESWESQESYKKTKANMHMPDHFRDFLVFLCGIWSNFLISGVCCTTGQT